MFKKDGKIVGARFAQLSVPLDRDEKCSAGAIYSSRRQKPGLITAFNDSP
jgi:hypothetical protein